MIRISIILGCNLLAFDGGVAAQDAASLEKTYAALCVTQAAQQGETCVALREAIANRPSVTGGGADGASEHANLSIADWGVLAHLAGTYWIAGPHSDGTVTIHRYVIIEHGMAVEFRAYTPGLPFGSRIVFRRGAVTGQLRADVHELGEAKGMTVNFRVTPDALQSDWYRFATTLGMGGVNLKKDVELTAQGVYLYKQGYGKGSDRPEPVNAFPDGFVQYAEQDAARIEARGEVAGKAAMDQAYKELAEEKRRQQRERSDRFSAAMSSLQDVLATANDIAAQREEQSRAQLNTAIASNTVANAIARGADAGQRADNVYGVNRADATSGPGSPLRFVLSIGLAPRAGDSVNPTCYSNVITREGPPGWGQRGIPAGSAQSAHATVQSLKSAFLNACRAASNRDLTSEGDFHWTWNETQDGESRIMQARAKYREDITVSL
jgi:hypothetical protein